ncbi:MAG: hypothetical protein AAFX50_04260, partial [Acidobacteriota bacterium]
SGLILRRLHRAFRHTVPIRGGLDTRVEIESLRWLADSSVEGISKRSMDEAEGDRVLRRWGLFQATQTTPLEESRSWRRGAEKPR